MDQPRLSIFARWPEPGQVKTRLIPSLGAEGAAVVYARLLAHTVAVATASGIPFELRATGAGEEAFRELLGFEVAVVPQGDGDLGALLGRSVAQREVFVERFGSPVATFSGDLFLP